MFGQTLLLTVCLYFLIWVISLWKPLKLEHPNNCIIIALLGCFAWAFYIVYFLKV